MTSHDVVAFARRLLGIREVGHAGTLDPDAAGVLPLLVGRATKILPFLQEVPKSYRAEMVFGISTDTMDASGRVTAVNRDFRIPRARLMDALYHFTGEIEQVPPMVSAVHYKGRRLYELAREGRSVERPARVVRIFSLSVFDWGPVGEWIEPGDTVTLDIRCSTGTYVRSLVDDIGRELSCGACLSFLVRTESAGFALIDSLTLEELGAMLGSGKAGDVLVPLSQALRHIPTIALRDSEVGPATHGSPIRLREDDERVGGLCDLDRVKLTSGDTVIAISRLYRVPGGFVIRPDRVLHQG